MGHPVFERVAVVGAGTMGNGIAQTFAAFGSAVRLVDVDAAALARGMTAIEGSLGRLVKKGAATEADAKATLARVAPSSDLAALKDESLVVEAIVEKVEAKRSVFEKLDHSLPPSSILATNTSSISITKIAAATKRPDKVIGMHFMNPVPLLKLVEVIRGQETSDETCA